MLTKNWKCLAVLCAFTLSLTAVEVQAATFTIIEDDFTGDGSMTGRTPVGTNLTGNDWATNASFWGTQATSSGEIVNVPHNSMSQIDISSFGSYTKPTELTMSATLRPDSDLRRGVGAVFSYLDPTPNNNGAWGQFLGLTLDETGRVDYYSTTFVGDFNSRSASSSVSWNAGADGAFDPSIFSTLSYTIDTVSGKLTAVSLSGSTQFGAGNAILLDAAAPFTDANTKWVGLSADKQSGGGATPADIGNFLLTGFVEDPSAIPEPSTLALAGIGLLGLLFTGRHRRRRA